MGTSSNTGSIDTKTTWTEDVQENYTFTTNGTSAASPTVAASIALGFRGMPQSDLQRCQIPYCQTCYTDRQHPIATWVTNAAEY